MTSYGYCVTHLIVHCKPCWRIILSDGIKVSQAAKAPIDKNDEYISKSYSDKFVMWGNLSYRYNSFRQLHSKPMKNQI